MNHTQECLEFQKRHEETVAAFRDKNPDYCVTCGGWGGSSSPGCSVPYGSTSVNLPDEFEPCPDCWGADDPICPHCGFELVSKDDQGTDEHICLNCGWDSENMPEGLPDYECLCWLQDDCEDL